MIKHVLLFNIYGFSLHTHSFLNCKRTASAQVSFGHGATSSSSIRTYGVPTSETSGRSSTSGLEDPFSDDKQEFINESDGTIVWSADAEASPAKLKKKEYKEPWVIYMLTVHFSLFLIHIVVTQCVYRYI